MNKLQKKLYRNPNPNPNPDLIMTDAAIIAVIAAIGAAGFGVWYFFFRGGSWTLGNPITTPTKTVAGSVCKMQFPVTNNTGTPTTVNLHADIVKLAINILLWPFTSDPGDVVDSWDSGPHEVLPGTTWTPEWDWTASVPQGVSLPATFYIVVALKDSSGILTPKTGPNNPNTFKQDFEVVSKDSSASVGFSMSDPTISPDTGIKVGDAVTITLPVQNTSSVSQTFSVYLEIMEVGSAGSQTGIYVDSTTLGPYTLDSNKVKNAVWNWIAKGEAGAGKWLSAKILINGNIAANVLPENPNTFKQTFDFVAVSNPVSTPVGHIVTPVEVDYNSNFSNTPVPVIINNPGYTMQFIFGAQNDSASSLNLGVTVVLTDPNGNTQNLVSGPTTCSGNNGLHILTPASNILTVPGHYDINIRLWYDTDDASHVLDRYIKASAIQVVQQVVSFTVEIVDYPSNLTWWELDYYSGGYLGQVVNPSQEATLNITNQIAYDGVCYLQAEIWDADATFLGRTGSAAQAFNPVNGESYVFDYNAGGVIYTKAYWIENGLGS